MVRDCQRGFIRGKSCASNLLEVLDHVGSLLDGGKQVDMIYMDMSKAFDKVNHGCLLQKLHEFGFGGSVLQWFSSYLMGRYQRVTVLGETSDPLPVSSGVPQGSIFNPRIITCCNFATYDPKLFCEELNSVNFEEVYSSISVNKAWVTFKTYIHTLLLPPQWGFSGTII